VRSRVFEEALIHTKLQTTLIRNVSKENSDDSKGNFVWAADKAFYKESLEIIKHVLTFCNQPQTRTTIMCKHDLSVEQLGRCIQYLLAQDLLVERGGEFVTTEKGKELLELFVKLRGFFGVDQIE
jgi:predicted transcriptional regulator